MCLVQVRRELGEATTRLEEARGAALEAQAMQRYRRRCEMGQEMRDGSKWSKAGKVVVKVAKSGHAHAAKGVTRTPWRGT